MELEAGPGLAPALAAGKPVPVARPATLADGMTPPFVGALPLAIAREAVDEIVAVTEAEIREAMKLLLTRAKLYVEGAGAAATAALLAGKVRLGAERAGGGARVGRQRRSGQDRRLWSDRLAAATARSNANRNMAGYFAASSGWRTPKVLPSVSVQ